MKTRVVRYWADGEWLHKVERSKTITEDDQWIIFGGQRCEVYPKPEIGSEYWELVKAELSERNAKRIAREMAREDTDVNENDVMSEFGT